jgi:uncharacterized repeat protein (TIGR03803 family)
MPTGRLSQASISTVAYFTLILLFVNGASATANLTVLHSFKNGSDGAYPNEQGPLIFDSIGNLYGTTQSGGSGTSCGESGCGTVFQLTPTNGLWIKTVLYNFSNNGTDGYSPQFGVSVDNAGNLYGVSAGGGVSGCGVIFQLTPTLGSWTENVLHSFHDVSSDGCLPSGGLISDAAGNLYGITSAGGDNGNGTVFQLESNSGNYAVICSLGAVFGDGSSASGALVFDKAGNLYGVTLNGGIYGYGTIFKLTYSSGWTETTIYEFTGSDNGANPYAGLTFDNQGNLYGTTYRGGTDTVGVVFRLTPTKGMWAIHVVHDFTGGLDGGVPTYGGVLMDSAGNLYGETLYGGLNGYLSRFVRMFDSQKPHPGAAQLRATRAHHNQEQEVETSGSVKRAPEGTRRTSRQTSAAGIPEWQERYFRRTCFSFARGNDSRSR